MQMTVSSVSPEIDRGLMYAEACFETFRVIHGQVFGWQAHIDRLADGLDAFGIGLPEGLKARCLDVAGNAGPDVLLRLTVTGGSAAWGLEPPVQRQPGIHFQAVPCRLRRTPLCLHSAIWPFPLRRKVAKYISDYAEVLRALHILRKRGLPAGSEALICNEQQFYSGMTANVLVYRENRWRTPPAAGILPGVIRNHLISAGVVSEVNCPRSWLSDCTALVLTNAGSFIQPVSSIDGRELISHGTIFNELWQALAGRPGVPEIKLCG